MYVRVITFKLHDLEPSGYLELAQDVAPAFTQWPGLLHKYWLAMGPDGRVGGVYVFTDKAAAEASRSTDVYQGMDENPHFADLHVEEYEVLAGPTAITSPVSQSAGSA